MIDQLQSYLGQRFAAEIMFDDPTHMERAVDALREQDFATLHLDRMVDAGGTPTTWLLAWITITPAWLQILKPALQPFDLLDAFYDHVDAIVQPLCGEVLEAGPVDEKELATWHARRSGGPTPIVQEK
jgi:hypothetical protein